MNDEQLTRLLDELTKTRTSFDDNTRLFKEAIDSIRWNRINTMIQYVLIVVVFCLGALGFWGFSQYRHSVCQNTNETRMVVSQGMELNAFAIGAALAVVFNAPEERLNQYMDAYHDQAPTEKIQLLEC